MEFINTLQSLLDEKSVSRNKFCADIGINKNAVANWEKRGNTPDGEVIDRIATYFNVTADYLLGRTLHPDVELIPADSSKAEKPTTLKGQSALTEHQLLINEIAEYLSRMDITKLKAFKEVLDI